jgi:hypothetical protein
MSALREVASMLRRAGLASVAGLMASWLVVGTSAAQSQPVLCTGEACARVEITGASGMPGSTVTISVSYTQGPDDGQAGQGNDEIAALALTLGMPGVASATPLALADCTEGEDGLTPAIRVNDAIKNDFRVVVENLRCITTSGTPRNRCLCPGGGQQQDNFINIVVYGPKELPSSGPVDIPVLPSGELMEIDLRINAGGTTELHVFSETDVQSEKPKPQFGAFASIGDRSAIDQTFDRTVDPNVSKLLLVNAEVTGGGPACIGDCDDSTTVTVDELVAGVSIALGLLDPAECPQFDEDGSNSVTVDELVKGVNNALNGCPA